MRAWPPGSPRAGCSLGVAGSASGLLRCAQSRRLCVRVTCGSWRRGRRCALLRRGWGLLVIVGRAGGPACSPRWGLTLRLPRRAAALVLSLRLSRRRVRLCPPPTRRPRPGPASPDTRRGRITPGDLAGPGLAAFSRCRVGRPGEQGGAVRLARRCHRAAERRRPVAASRRVIRSAMVAKRFALTVARQMYRAAGVPADEARRLAFDGAWTPGAALFALRCENRRRIDGKGTRKYRGL